jgi:NAD(P)-dependent dehydrogenase (short-subunit alcohol dehydrogenase family)
MTERLKGKLALITGASRGIGLAIARAYLAEGARIVMVSRKAEALEQAAVGLGAPGRVWARACHVGQTAQLDELLSFCEQGPGLPEILVNNAGTNPHFGPLFECTSELFDKIFEVNLKGPFELSRRLCQRWVAAGRGGCIINIASILGQRAAPLQGVYGMTKAAIISFTRTLSFEMGRQGIRANAIAPGLIETRLSQALVGSPDILKLFTDRTGLGRHGQPQEIAGAAVFLASDEAAYINGATLNVDGGYGVS